MFARQKPSSFKARTARRLRLQPIPGHSNSIPIKALPSSSALFSAAASGDYPAALKDYDRAVAIGGENVPLRHARAKLLLEMDRPREALDDLNAAVEQDKYAFLVYVMRAGVHQRLGHAQAALEDLNNLIYGPKGGMPFAMGGDQLAGFLMQRALVLSDLGRPSEAANDMLSAARLAGKRKLLRLQVYLRQQGHPVRSMALRRRS